MKRILALIVAAGGIARAQDSQTKAQADALFDEGKQLLASGDYAKACADFESSLKLLPQLGTHLNLADCYAKAGRVASAWAEFRESASVASKAGDPRADFAKQRAAELEKKIDKLVITAPPGTPADLAVTRDGQKVLPELIGKPIPIDAGKHTIEATATGFAPFSTEVDVEGEATVSTAAIVLQPLGGAGAPAPVRPPPPTVSEGASGRKTVGIVLLAGGAAVLGTGLVFGGLASSEWGSSKSDCTTSTVCGDTGYDHVQSAYRDARIADVLVFGGAAVAITGAIVWLTAPSSHPHAAMTVLPAPGGVSIAGVF
jgi:tetratricopeptide (TPR) repeat protein